MESQLQLCEEKNACLNSCIILFCFNFIVFHMYWSHGYVYMNMTHDKYSHEISALFFTHNFPRNSAEAKINEVGREQNIRKQCNLLWLFQIPFTLTLRLWDIFILEGEKILTGMAYNIIKLHRSKWNDKAWLLSLWNFYFNSGHALLMKSSSLLMFKCLK